MPYLNQPFPGNIDTPDLLRRSVEEEFQRLANAYAEDEKSNTARLAALEATALKLSHGQCKFIYVSFTQCRLIPWNGNLLKINGVLQQVPDAGVNISNATVVAGAMRYVYAFMNAGVMTLELSATAYVVSTATNNKGVAIKNGDATRSLVGLIYGGVGAIFADQPDARFVRSWFNDVGVIASVFQSTNPTTASLVEIEMDTAMRAHVLMWANEYAEQIVNAAIANNTVGAVSYLRGGITTAGVGLHAFYNEPTVNYYQTLAQASMTFSNTEQLLIFTQWTLVSAGTATFSYRNNTVVTQRR